MPDIEPQLESGSKRIKVEVEDLFLKFHGVDARLARSLQVNLCGGSEQKLLPRDLALLLVLMQQCHPMTGRIGALCLN